MIDSNQKVKLNDELLDNVAGGVDCTIPEYVHYENDPDRFNAILGGTCPNCGQEGNTGNFCSNCGRSVVTEEKSGGAAAEDQRETQERRP